MSDTETPGAHISDELLDDINASMMQLGRLFMSRHHDIAHAHHSTDITGSKYLAMRAIKDAGSARVSDIAEQLGVKAPAASAIVEQLVGAGLVERTDDPDDRRATRILSTPAGDAMIDEAERCRRDMMRRYLSVLTEEDVRAMVRINRTMIEAMLSDRI